MNMKKLLIIGSSGLVGSKFASSILSNRKVAPNEIELDITDEKIVNDFFEMEKDNFDAVVNFAGFTNVDVAEKERGDENGFCYRLNVDGPENLAKACKKYNKFLIQISTDFVFNGTSDYPGPYSERSLTPDKLTETAKTELELVLKDIVQKDQKRFVDFFNEAQPLSTRMHQLELLPGLGKKHMWQILEARKEKPFESFEDIKKRVKLMPDPEKAVIRRILKELSGSEKHRVFVDV